MTAQGITAREHSQFDRWIRERSPSVAEILRRRAASQPDRPVFTLLADDPAHEVTVTFSALERSARAVAVALDQNAIPGERVLLALPPGRAYLSAFFGCLHAGAIPVPCYPPRSRRHSWRLLALAQDCQAGVVIVECSMREMVTQALAEDARFRRVRVLVVDEISADAADAYRQPADESPLALLQHTSGSTAAPKGVMVGHDNILANVRCMTEHFGLGPEMVAVTWCPPFHDMGLFTGVVAPVIVGFRSLLQSPVSFVMRPVSWLEAISRHRAAASGGPNFGYELCVDRIPPQLREGLDLSSWTHAYNGAEPVRARTLQRFTEAFEPYGFRREAFHPCYGMAESTLVITAGGRGPRPVIRAVDGNELSRGRAVEVEGEARAGRTVVGCGEVASGHAVLVVDPDTRILRPEGYVGEIWVQGPSVAHGYWGNPGATEETFRAHLDGGEGPFLRTGDLGYWWRDDLYVIGRRKDMIIIRGRNHSPADIELTVGHSHPALQPEGAAFSVPLDGPDAEERLVVVATVKAPDPDLPVDDIVTAIRGAVTAEHDLEVDAVVLLPRNRLPRTTSGKVQRGACQARFVAGALPALHAWRRDTTAPAEFDFVPPSLAEPEVAGPATAARIEDWLAGRLARRLGISARDVAVDRPFAELGLDSAEGVRMAADLSVLLGRPLPPSLIWDYPTAAGMARYLTEPTEPDR